MKRQEFKEDEIPYSLLEPFGLSQDMIEDLPAGMLSGILAGRPSPLLPITITMDDGQTIKARTRLRLIRSEDGTADILFSPQLEKSDLSAFSDEERDSLLQGKAIVALSPRDSSTHCFVQIDPETSQVLFVPTPVIGRNLRVLMNGHSLTSAEIQVLQEGDTVTFMEGDEMVTAGIDLTFHTGIRLETGDMERWRSLRGEAMEEYSFGLYGCWKRDEDGLLSYIHEDEYTDDIWEEQRKAIVRNSQMHR